jgi:hypothetical protein
MATMCAEKEDQIIRDKPPTEEQEEIVARRSELREARRFARGAQPLRDLELRKLEIQRQRDIEKRRRLRALRYE